MKKMLVVVLSVILTVSLAVPATAAGKDTPSEQPFLVSTTSKDVRYAFLNEADELTEEEMNKLTEAEKEELKAAEAELDDADLGMDTRDLFYFHTNETADAVFYIPDNPNLIAKQFIDGKWVKLDTEVDEKDCTITVKDAIAAPMIFYTIGRKMDSPTAPMQSGTATAPLPVLISCTSEDYALYSVVEEYKLEMKGRQTFLDGQNTLRETLPEGMSARYFFYFYTSTPCTAVFRILNAQDVVVKQYLDRAWVELETTINADGNVTVENVVKGPMAIFTKQ